MTQFDNWLYVHNQRQNPGFFFYVPPCSLRINLPGYEMMFSSNLDFSREVWPGGRDVKVINISMVIGVRKLYKITQDKCVMWEQGQIQDI